MNFFSKGNPNSTIHPQPWYETEEGQKSIADAEERLRNAFVARLEENYAAYREHGAPAAPTYYLHLDGVSEPVLQQARKRITDEYSQNYHLQCDITAPGSYNAVWRDLHRCKGRNFTDIRVVFEETSEVKKTTCNGGCFC